MGSSLQQSPHIRPPRLVQTPTHKNITIDYYDTYLRLKQYYDYASEKTFSDLLNHLMDVVEKKGSIRTLYRK